MISMGHEIGKPELLFSRIPPEKAMEWRKLFGNSEAEETKTNAKNTKAAKKAAKKAVKKAVGEAAKETTGAYSV